MTDSSDTTIAQAHSVVERIKPLMAGLGGDVHGVVLIELVGLFLVGHHPALREQALQLHVDTVRRLVPVLEAVLFGAAGHPGKQ